MSWELSKIIKDITTITTIDLDGNSIGAEGCSSLAKALETNTTITTIDLHYNSIGAEGCSSLAKALETNTTITNINLFRNSIGAEGCSSLAKALETNTTITTINLSSNSIGDEGCSSLAKALETNTTLNLEESALPDFNTPECLKLLKLDDSFIECSNQEIVNYLRQQKREAKLMPLAADKGLPLELYETLISLQRDIIFESFSHELQVLNTNKDGISKKDIILRKKGID